MSTLLHAAQGLRARAGSMGLALAYYLVAFGCVIGASSALRSATGRTLAEQLSDSTESALLGHAILFLALVAVPTIAMLLITRGKFETSGWALKHWPLRFGLGVLLGAGTMALTAAALSFIGVLRIEIAAPTAASMVVGVFPWIVVWLVQSMHEEALARGYGFVQISRSLGFWPAALLSSAAFAAGHLGNEGETTLGLANAGLIGLALAYTLKRTGSLWLALGFHASWNFTQSTVLGLVNSGSDAQYALAHSTLVGPQFLTGGSAGPEGSVLATVAALVLMASVHLSTRATSDFAQRKRIDDDE